MENKYTKEDIIQFNKIIGEYNRRNYNINYIDHIIDYIGTFKGDNSLYVKHILEVIGSIKKNIEYKNFIDKSLTDMPLYINDTSLLGRIAEWRIKIGK